MAGAAAQAAASAAAALGPQTGAAWCGAGAEHFRQLRVVINPSVISGLAGVWRDVLPRQGLQALPP